MKSVKTRFHAVALGLSLMALALPTAASATMLTGPSTLNSQSLDNGSLVQARWYGHRGWHRHGGWGVGAGGLVAGAIISGLLYEAYHHHHHHYYGERYHDYGW